MSNLKQWYELSEPTPLVKRGAREYYDDIPVKPVFIQSASEIECSKGYHYYMVNVQKSDGSVVVVRGKTKDGFTTDFVPLSLQPVYCSVSIDAAGELRHCLMPRQIGEVWGSAKAGAAQVTPKGQKERQTPPKSCSEAPEEPCRETLSREDEIAAWAIGLAVSSQPRRNRGWDSNETQCRAEIFKSMHRKLLSFDGRGS